MRTFFGRLLLAVLLLLAQQGVALHGLSHVAAAAAQAQTEGDHEPSGAADPCTLCLAFSQAAAALAAEATPPSLLAGLAFHAAPGPLESRATPRLPAPRSRGPPTRL